MEPITDGKIKTSQEKKTACIQAVTKHFKIL